MELAELTVDLDLNVLGSAFDAQERTSLSPSGVLVKRALKRLDSDVNLVKLDIAPKVIDDLNWLMCQQIMNCQ